MFKYSTFVIALRLHLKLSGKPYKSFFLVPNSEKRTTLNLTQV